MRLIVELGNRIALAFTLTWIWSKWYLPGSFVVAKYVTTMECTLSVLWLIHFSLRFPMAGPAKRESMKQYLPRYRR